MKTEMRRILIIAVVMMSYSCIAQEKSSSLISSELPKELFQRWKLSYAMSNGELISGLPESPINDYEFKPNGEYLLFDNNDVFMVGTWEYNREEKAIYTKRADGEINGKIIDIKTKSITIVPEGKMIKGTPFENFRFYYVPFE